MKGHYSIEHFKTSKDFKLKEIYKRAARCKNCMNNYFHDVLFQDHRSQRDALDNTIGILEESVQLHVKKLVCNYDCDWITPVGIYRVSPVFYKQLNAILVSRKFPSFLVKVLDGKIDKLFESGLSLNMKERFNNFNFQIVSQSKDPHYQGCLAKNDIKFKKYL